MIIKERNYEYYDITYDQTSVNKDNIIGCLLLLISEYKRKVTLFQFT